ncbi:hypothetical protein EX895_001073 [Sporisorium graminicola]|uniref:Glycosyltransferase 2-like domain-containing protein n=1 Tax=Sporisorium graminicola TaxID=280036 RepID=A0A4U7KZF0_9BASI|nr:hypothetical protein EX895_001073 [Sporisorium graminicola]TKY89776.1 hypothetical protein EX895_001073 [Sporisorium graminicola]
MSVATTEPASSLYSTGVKEGWIGVNQSSGVVLVDDIFPNENAQMLSWWRDALRGIAANVSSANCMVLASTPLVSNLLEQHDNCHDASSTTSSTSGNDNVIYLTRRRGMMSALPVFDDAQKAIDFYSDEGNSNQVPLQFVLRQECTLCLLHSNPRLLRSMARDVDARIFRFLATRMGQDSTTTVKAPLTASVPPPMLAMSSHTGSIAGGALTPSSIFTQHSMQAPQHYFMPSPPAVERFSSSSIGSKSSHDDDSSILSEKPVLPSPVVTENPVTGEKVLQQDRQVRYLAPLVTGLGLGLNVFMMSGFIAKIVIETLVDGNYARFAFVVLLPFFMLVSQFLWENLTACVAQICFPIRQMHENSLYYSGQASEPLPPDHVLPQFTINMPCYKEGLSSVLAPSLESALEAVRAYRALGGVANIVVSEDGLRLLTREEAEERIRYYSSMGVGWVARPRHSSEEGGYIRKGRFKKASNLNFTYNLSLRTEEILESNDGQSGDLEQQYNEALAQAVEESNGLAWASGNIRIGDHILLIDSDTRMPADCLIEAAAEMERCPEVGALQHCSGVMYVQNHYFERFIGYFTSACVNFSISWICANGAMAPLMGHNVFLRWKAVQEVSNLDTDGERTFFSPHHVSEDFEMALKLQMKGYVIRWATYSDQGFTEGVSFTPEDETARFQKYAYGCSEIVFNPLRQWFTRGPISKLFRTFITSDVNASYKIATISYLSTYYALAIAFPVTVVVFVVQGLFLPYLDPIFLPSFDVFVTVTVVFTLAGGMGLITARARSGHASFGQAALQAVGHAPAMAVFFSGLAFHIMTALAAHMFGYNMTWGSTNKDFKQSSLRAVIRRFWTVYVVMTVFLLAVILSCSPLVPLKWRMESFQLLVPVILLCSMHILFPIILDPGVLEKYLPDIGQNEFALKLRSKQKAFFHTAGQRVKSKYVTHFSSAADRAERGEAGAQQLSDEVRSEKDAQMFDVASPPSNSPPLRMYSGVV